MANAITAAKLVNILVSLIARRRVDNVSRFGDHFKDDADRNKLTAALVGGWNPSLGIPRVYELNLDERKSALVEREQERVRLQQATGEQKVMVNGKMITITASDFLRDWDELYTKGGKIIAPMYGLVCTNRRNEILPAVNAIHRKLGIELITQLPCDVRIYASEIERHVETMLENTQHNTGTKQLTAADKANASRILFQGGATDSDMRRVFGAGEGQKRFAICSLDKRFPELKMVDKIIDGSIVDSQLNKEELRKLLSTNASQVLVKAYLDDPKAGKDANKPKMADRAHIEALGNQCPAKVVADTAKAIEMNNIAALRPYGERSADLNIVVQIVMGDDEKAREQLIVLARKLLGLKN
jgi:hypothetical protein